MKKHETVDHIQINLTNESRENLRIMADYVKTRSLDTFGMRNWVVFQGQTKLPNTEHPCGSVCCIVGSAPALRKKYPQFTPGNLEGWDNYARRIFLECEDDSDCEDVYQYLFESDWYNRDNSADGAAARIEYFLEHGLPDNWMDQIGGDPLSYRIGVETCLHCGSADIQRVNDKIICGYCAEVTYD
jgi:hypothetical protein